MPWLALAEPGFFFSDSVVSNFWENITLMMRTDQAFFLAAGKFVVANFEQNTRSLNWQPVSSAGTLMKHNARLKPMPKRLPSPEQDGGGPRYWRIQTPGGKKQPRTSSGIASMGGAAAGLQLSWQGRTIGGHPCTVKHQREHSSNFRGSINDRRGRLQPPVAALLTRGRTSVIKRPPPNHCEPLMYRVWRGGALLKRTRNVARGGQAMLRRP